MPVEDPSGSRKFGAENALGLLGWFYILVGCAGAARILTDAELVRLLGWRLTAATAGWIFFSFLGAGLLFVVLRKATTALLDILAEQQSMGDVTRARWRQQKEQELRDMRAP